MSITEIHSKTSASILGHLFLQKGFLPLSDEPPSERNNEVVAGVSGCSSSSPWSLRSSLARSGVCSVVRLEGCDRADRDDRADLRELRLVDLRVLGV